MKKKSEFAKYSSLAWFYEQSLNGVLFVNRVFQCMSFPQFKEGPWSRKPRDTSRVTTLYSVDPVLDRNHDAVIRIKGSAPEWWAHSSDRHLCHGLGYIYRSASEYDWKLITILLLLQYLTFLY